MEFLKYIFEKVNLEKKSDGKQAENLLRNKDIVNGT